MRPLVDVVAALIEATYDLERSVRPVGRFVIGDEGHARLTARYAVRETVDGPATGARLLLRRRRGARGWAVALYLPDRLVARLEACDPRCGLDGENIDEFLALTEEIDHLVTFADRVGHAKRDVSLLELEWHAGVSKYLVAAHFVGKLAGRAQLTEDDRATLEACAFPDGRYEGLPEEVRDRYKDADRLARSFLHDLYRRRPADRLRRLRRFHRASHHQKLRLYANVG